MWKKQICLGFYFVSLFSKIRLLLRQKRSKVFICDKNKVHATTTTNEYFDNNNNNKDFLYYYVKKEERRGWRRGRARCWRPSSSGNDGDEDSFRRFVLFLEARTNAKHVDDAAFVSRILGRRRRRSDFTAPLRDHVDVERPRRRHRRRRRARTTMVLYARRRRDGILECR